MWNMISSSLSYAGSVPATANGGTRRDRLGGRVSSLPIERIEKGEMRHIGEKSFAGGMKSSDLVRWRLGDGDSRGMCRRMGFRA